MKEEHICRLCLKVAKNEFEVDEIMTKIFEILLLKVDFVITSDPIICQDCMEVAKKWLNFKLTCIHTEQIILSYSIDRKEVKHNIKVIYEPREHMRASLEDFKICRFCMTQFETNNFISLDTLKSESMFEMLSQFMTEMDFNAIEYPVICAKCRENLEGYFKFVVNCLESEVKLKAYCKKKERDSMGQVKLGGVPQLMFIDILEYPDKSPQTCRIEQDLSGYADPEIYIDLIKHEGLGNEIVKRDMTINNDATADMFEHNLCTSQEEQQHIFINPIIGLCKQTSEPKRKKNINRCMVIENNSFNPQSYISVDKDASKIKMHKCSLCVYETKNKWHLTGHMLVHKERSEIEMQKCLLCPFQSKHKKCLTRHMLLHKDVSEIEMQKCSSCTFESKHKPSLKQHMLRHKNVLEIKKFKCPLCDYDCKHRSNLRTHMLIHKDVSEIKMHKCSLCAYECKQKSYLTSHMLVHKDMSEIKLHKCPFCTYEAKRKSTLGKHMLVHKDVSDIKMQKCSSCAFESKHKTSLTRHMLVHKNISEIKMYQCSLCAYEVKRKSELKKHVLVHKNLCPK